MDKLLTDSWRIRWNKEEDRFYDTWTVKYSRDPIFLDRTGLRTLWVDPVDISVRPEVYRGILSKSAYVCGIIGGHTYEVSVGPGYVLVTDVRIDLETGEFLNPNTLEKFWRPSIVPKLKAPRFFKKAYDKENNIDCL